MSMFRAMTITALLWAGLCTSAAAMEVLPMDTPEEECPGANAQPVASESIAAEPAPAALSESVETIGGVAVAPAGIESSTAVERPERVGGSAGTSTPATKPSSRWNAFLPGMVR